MGMKIKVFLEELLSEKEIIKQLIVRDISLKYRGSKLGIWWTAINPLLMLAVYTLVFSQVFKARWGINTDETQGPIYFGLNIFCGLIIFNLFAECTIKSPNLICSNPNFVKKIIFPISTLGVTIVGSALIQSAINCLVLVIVQIVLTHNFQISTILIPIIWLPIALKCLGITWVLSVIGVYIKDIGQVVNPLTNMMMFLSPIFYPSEALPEKIRWLTSVNPLTFGIEETRNAIIKGQWTNAQDLIIQIIGSLVICQGGYWLLTKNKRYFGDLV